MSRDADRNAAAERAVGLFCQGGPGRVWFVFHARPRCEKKVAKTCLDLQIHHYLPLHKSVGRKRKRRYSFEVPLFPGYLFGCCDAQERLDLVRSGYLVRTIEVTSPTASYSAADQTTDFGSAQSNVDMKIYQLSAVIGRGYAASATV